MRQRAGIWVTGIRVLPSSNKTTQHLNKVIYFRRHYTMSKCVYNDFDNAFNDVGLSKECQEALTSLHFNHLTDIQTRCIPELLKRRDVMFGAPTGTGKTLAYLLPTLQQLRAEERKQSSNREPARPRALVLVPTRELAHQVLGVLKSITHYAKLRSFAVTGGVKRVPQKRNLQGVHDVVVGTPGRMLEHLEKGHFFMSRVGVVIIDEADTLLSPGFQGELVDLLAPILKRKARGDRIQAVVASATITTQLRTTAINLFPVRSGLHKPRSHTIQNFVFVGAGNKHLHLLHALQDNPNKKTIVFCNTLASAQATDHFLREHGIASASMHGDVPSAGRKDVWREFMDKGGHVDVLVATDVGARGLDTTEVHHVVCFDFPLNTIDYLHRIGRTSRHTPGLVTNLLKKRDLVLANEIQEANRRNLSLESLSSSKAHSLFT